MRGVQGYQIHTKSMYADLKSRIQIREVVNTETATGGMDTTYSVKCTIWGNVKPLSASAQLGFFMREVQVKSQPTHIIRMRINKELEVTREGLQGNMYLYIEDREGKGRSFRILSAVDKEDRGIELNVIVREMGIQFGDEGMT